MTLVRVPDVVHEREPRAWIDLLAPAAELARTIAPTEFVPRAYRNNPPAIAAAVLYGDEIGLGPLVAVNEIHVIDGRVFVSAEAQRALVLAAGHELWLETSTTSRVTWRGRRAGSDHVGESTWTLDDAERARISGKPNWKAYPRQMLSARASAELCRAMFADVLGGIGALEEFDDLEATHESAAAPPAPRTRRRRGTVAAAATAPEPGPATVPALPPLPGETYTERADVLPTVEPLEDRQRRRLQSLARSRGLDRADRMTLGSEIVGRTLSSWNELTRGEAQTVIERLEQLPVAERMTGEGVDDEQQHLEVET